MRNKYVVRYEFEGEDAKRLDLAAFRAGTSRRQYVVDAVISQAYEDTSDVDDIDDLPFVPDKQEATL